MLCMFNVFFTSLPPIMCGLFEKDAPEDSLMMYPEAYYDFCQIHPPFSLTIFMRWCGDAIIQSMLYFFYCYGIISRNDNVWSNDGKTAGLFGFGTLLFTFEVIIINLKMLSLCQYWNVFVLWSPVIGILAYIVLMLAYEQMCWYNWDGCYVFSWVISKQVFWLSFFPFIILSLLPGVLLEVIRKNRDPSLGDILNEASHVGYNEDSFGNDCTLKEVCHHYKNVKL